MPVECISRWDEVQLSQGLAYHLDNATLSPGPGEAFGNAGTVRAILKYSLKVEAISACIGVKGKPVPVAALPGVSISHIDSNDGLSPRS